MEFNTAESKVGMIFCMGTAFFSMATISNLIMAIITAAVMTATGYLTTKALKILFRESRDNQASEEPIHIQEHIEHHQENTENHE